MKTMLITTTLLALFAIGCSKSDSPSTQPTPPPAKKAHPIRYSWSISNATTHEVAYTMSSSSPSVVDSISTHGSANTTLYTGDQFALALSGDAPSGRTITFTATVMVNDTVYKSRTVNANTGGGLVIGGGPLD